METHAATSPAELEASSKQVEASPKPVAGSPGPAGALPDQTRAFPDAVDSSPPPEVVPVGPLPGRSWAGDDGLSEFPTEGGAQLPWTPSTLAPAIRKHHRWLVGVVLVVVCAAAVAAWRWRASNAGAEPRDSTVGTLAIESSPAGAAVSIDGTSRGTTPLTLSLPAGNHQVVLTAGSLTRELRVSLAAGAQVVHHVELAEAAATTGRLQITAPPGAPVFLDGAPRGLAPVELKGISAGAHTVTVGDGAGAVTQRVVVPAGGVASLLAPLGQAGRAAPAWISVVAPFELQVYDGDSLIGTSRTERILVLAGRHSLRLVNTSLQYESTRPVQVEAGRVSVVRIDPPNGVLSVNALPWAEVFIDGKRIGETPIANIGVPIGSHEITLRNPKFPEQTRSVVVTLAGPTRLGVDMRQ